MAGKQTTQTGKARWNDKTSGNELPFMEVMGHVVFRFLAFSRQLAIYRSSAIPCWVADRADRIKGVFGFRHQSLVGGAW